MAQSTSHDPHSNTHNIDIPSTEQWVEKIRSAINSDTNSTTSIPAHQQSPLTKYIKEDHQAFFQLMVDYYDEKDAKKKDGIVDRMIR